MPVPSECPVCTRRMCDHTPAQRRQSFEEMMGDVPVQEKVQIEGLSVPKVRSAIPLDVQDLITPRLCEALASGILRATVDKGLKVEMETEDGCCLQFRLLNMTSPADVGNSEDEILRQMVFAQRDPRLKKRRKKKKKKC